MDDEGRREFPAEQILKQAAAYPPMAHGECQMSTVILAAAYPELRYVKGTRHRIIAAPAALPVTTEVLHWWNELPDGTVIDSAFQPGRNTARQLPYVTLHYTEEEMSEADREGAEGQVRLLRRLIQKEMKTLVGTERERHRQVSRSCGMTCQDCAGTLSPELLFSRASSAAMKRLLPRRRAMLEAAKGYRQLSGSGISARRGQATGLSSG